MISYYIQDGDSEHHICDIEGDSAPIVGQNVYLNDFRGDGRPIRHQYVVERVDVSLRIAKVPVLSVMQHVHAQEPDERLWEATDYIKKNYGTFKWFSADKRHFEYTTQTYEVLLKQRKEP